MLFVKCYNPKCGRVKIEFSEGNYMVCERCGKQADDRHPDILRAILAANCARFEYGENPAPSEPR